MNYGPVLSAAFVLWPLMAVLGGQGFAPLLGLTGLAALFVARPKLPPAIFAMTGFAFIAWAALSELWTPGGSALVSGSLREGSFSVQARSVSAGLITLMAALTIAASLQAAPSPKSLMLITLMLAVQGVLVLASSVLAGPVLSVVYGDSTQRLNEGVQNIARAANVLALALPLLLSVFVGQGKLAGAALAAVLVPGLAAIYLAAGNHSAFFAMVGAGAAIALVAILPRTGFRWLFGMLAVYVAAAPVLMAGLVRALDPFAATLPPSFRSRLWSWETVIGRLSEAPFTGHGLNATRQWKATFETRPDWLAQLPVHWRDYPIVPGHPHNMALQIWAETGLTGAWLVALSLVALSLHLPRPQDLKAEIRFAAAGLTGAATVIFSFAYSLWNEGFWSALALMTAAIVVFHRTLKARAS
ncbi:MAG: O-antigen ligase family protein [Hyphomonas sp.]